MVPVSSTVIPLPVYKVGYGLGFISKDKKAQSSFKPEGGIKLITSKYIIKCSLNKITKSYFRKLFFVTFSFPFISVDRNADNMSVYVSWIIKYIIRLCYMLRLTRLHKKKFFT